ncbi:XXYS1_4_G0048190.mRNA.1.CDS.1 [Saccharomyces cerevisiae]|nr:XXYS1_4_G0048190.mRNA.1.CDS.1 [Saccharomyces cerevisiae]
MNRLSFIKTPFNIGAKWRLEDVFLLIIMILLNYPVYYQQPFERQFYINDLTISHPYATTERVNNNMLFVYSFVVPSLIILIIGSILADRRHLIFILYTSLLGLSLAWFSTSFFTNFIKNWIGRLRPDFLDRCQPLEGLSLDTLFTAKDVCTTKNHERLLDGFRTTPSGHSSESFAGLGYLYFWLCGQLLTESPLMPLWRKMVAFLPLLGAALIALSRTQDYRHHFVDVILGSMLGYIMAHFFYRRTFPPIDDPLPFKPLMDDSDVTLEEAVTHQRIPDEELHPLSDEGM